MSSIHVYESTYFLYEFCTYFFTDPSLLTEVDLALSGLARVFSVECGDDLAKIRLEMLGSNEGRTRLPGGHVIVPAGVNKLGQKLSDLLPKRCIRLGHVVKHIDWSLLSRDPHLPDKITVECRKYDELTGSPSSSVIINADYVICTLPIGVLKSSHNHLFHPRLTSEKVSPFIKENVNLLKLTFIFYKVQSIMNIGNGQSSKIFLEWKDPWWALGEGGIQLAWPEHSTRSLSRRDLNNGDHDEYRRHWYRGISNFSEVENHPNLLMCWVAGDSAAIADDLDDEEVLKVHFLTLTSFDNEADNANNTCSKGHMAHLQLISMRAKHIYRECRRFLQLVKIIANSFLLK